MNDVLPITDPLVLWDTVETSAIPDAESRTRIAAAGGGGTPHSISRILSGVSLAMSRLTARVAAAEDPGSQREKGGEKSNEKSGGLGSLVWDLLPKQPPAVFCPAGPPVATPAKHERSDKRCLTNSREMLDWYVARLDYDQLCGRPRCVSPRVAVGQRATLVADSIFGSQSSALQRGAFHSAKLSGPSPATGAQEKTDHSDAEEAALETDPLSDGSGGGKELSPGENLSKLQATRKVESGLRKVVTRRVSFDARLLVRRQFPIIYIPGGGIFFFWKAGFLLYLQQHFDLSQCCLVGASAGALAAFTALCCPSISHACRTMLKIAENRLIWNSRRFIGGHISSIFDEWTQLVLKEGFSVDSLRGRLAIIARRLSRQRLEAFVDFTSTKDMLACLYASIHIPFYANGRATTRARKRRYLDGSFGPSITKVFGGWENEDDLLVVRCNAQDYEQPIKRLDCIKRLPPQGLLQLVHDGHAFAAKLHREHSDMLLRPLAMYEKCAPATFRSEDDPYLQWERWEDPTLFTYSNGCN